ncbi:MAG: hypothetical protein CK426_04840 [Legionella sp.]|nr:MAG: hypothetical protein CK423_04205 [Legionella sp.]PJD98815.1 MAG: hypothetical protein CK426_04840 [Legionella sp.]
MKKLVLGSLISSFAVGTALAGAMGDTDCSPSAFASIEGGYTWATTDGVTLNGINAPVVESKSQNQLSGRLAAGLIHMMDDEYGITGELGWGYYGNTTYQLPVVAYAYPVNMRSKYTISGFDALIGLSYVQTYYTLYAKVGGMIQNLQLDNTSYVYPDDPITSIYTLTKKSNQAAALPAAKLGIGYNVDANWSVTGSYLITYGASPGVTLTYVPGTIDNYTISENNQNPMTNTFMLGIQYAA